MQIYCEGASPHLQPGLTVRGRVRHCGAGLDERRPPSTGRVRRQGCRRLHLHRVSVSADERAQVPNLPFAGESRRGDGAGCRSDPSSGMQRSSAFVMGVSVVLSRLHTLVTASRGGRGHGRA